MASKILYIGPDAGTCRQRRCALERLGNLVTHCDPRMALPANVWAERWLVKTGALGAAAIVERRILADAGATRYDLALVDGGHLVSPRLVRRLKERADQVILVNLDNPYVPRDGAKWRLLRKAAVEYDLCVVNRRSTAEAALRSGARKVMQTDFAADEVVHRPRALTEEERARFTSDVVFVGTWMPERGPFLATLVARGVPLQIWGERWSKAPEFDVLRPHYRGPALGNGDYGAALIGSTIAIGLLSEGNEDLHTTRSMETPALGVLFCGKRTVDHMAMYREGEEAVFWSDADECAAVCLSLLKQPGKVRAIAAAGRRRVLANRSFNEPLMAGILDEVVRPTRNSGLVLHPTVVNRDAECGHSTATKSNATATV